MKLRDKELKRDVDVKERECFGRSCYWPRQNPGSFVQGRGYRSYGDARDKEWICGTRDARGCPSSQ